MARLNTNMELGGMRFSDDNGNTVAFATATDGMFCLLFSDSSLLPEGIPHQIHNVSLKTCEWLALAAQQHIEDTGY